ncbi:hypothetical protein TW65_04111 [Stemphylium lycopersici]|nr:hypothetical protein TW65_04111 [Stemphylium lycopersici]
MSLLQNPPSVPMLDSKPIAPPPYTMQSVQLPTPTSIPNATTSSSPVQGQQQQYQQVQTSQPSQYQYPQTTASPRQEFIVQSPYQGISNMTPQQVQHVQHVIQNMPTEKLQMVQQQVQQQMISPHPQAAVMPPQPIQSPPAGQLPPAQKPHFTTTAPQGLFGPKTSSGSSHTSGPQDAQKSDTVKRFFGDTLFGRVARSSVQTASSLTKMPTSLSPWGDNNPVTLPNVRYRDAVLFTTFAFVGGPLTEGIADSVTSTFGADSFASEIINSGAGAIAASTVLKYSVFQIVEQAIDKGVLEHMLPEEEKMLQTTNVTSIQVTVKHKLMGVDADVRFVGVYPSLNTQACEKGWFAPYLFASARTPLIPRVNDFAIAQCFGPFLGGMLYPLTSHMHHSTSHLS